MKKTLKIAICLIVCVGLASFFATLYHSRTHGKISSSIMTKPDHGNSRAFTNETAEHFNKAVMDKDECIMEAKTALVNQNYSMAIAILETVLDTHADQRGEEQFVELCTIAYANLMQGKLPEALNATERMVAVYSTAFSKMMRCFILMRAGKTDKSLKILEEVEKENPDDTGILISVHNCRCLIYYSLGKFREGQKEHLRFDELFRSQFWDYENIPEYQGMKTLSKYFSTNPPEHSLVLSDELPPPATRKQDDPQKIEFTINVYYNVVQNIDGSIVYSGSMGW